MMPTRRNFLKTIWIALGGLVILEYAWLARDFLKPRRRRRGAASEIFVAGPLERFEPNSVTAFPKGRFYLVRLDSGAFLAVSRECTHLGCTVPWNDDERRFVCPCHSSSFDITGEVFSPPAPRALDLYAVRIENGIVKVDISRPRKRKTFETSQPVWP